MQNFFIVNDVQFSYHFYGTIQIWYQENDIPHDIHRLCMKLLLHFSVSRSNRSLKDAEYSMITS